MLPNPNRPAGITLLAIFNYMGAVVFILLGLVFLLWGLLGEASGFPPFPDENPANVHAASSGTNLLFLVIWVAIVSSIGLLLGHGLWTLKRWAWMGELLVLGSSIAMQIQSIASQIDFGQFVVQIIVLIYLLQPRVRRAFR